MNNEEINVAGLLTSLTEPFDPYSYEYFEQLKSREIFINGEVDERCARYAQLILRWNSEDRNNKLSANDRIPIRIYISSVGGDSYSANALIGAIQCSVTPIFTIAMGACCSAGANIFIAPKPANRYMLPYTTILFHRGYSGIDGTLSDIAQYGEYMAQDIQRDIAYISAQTKISKKLLAEYKDKDMWMFPDEALKMGVTGKVAKTVDELPI